LVTGDPPQDVEHPKDGSLLYVWGSPPGVATSRKPCSLAERQPYLSEAEATLNHGLYLYLSEQIVELIRRPQEGFSPSLAWLRRLIRLWNQSETSVVSLNYDTLVEAAVGELKMPGASYDPVDGILQSIPRRVPPLPTPVVYGYTAPWFAPAGPTRSFALLKLHGSVDWYWSPLDTAGDSLCRVPAVEVGPEVRASLAGKVPFIVPPLASKGPLYNLGVMRHLWQRAALALRNATEIVLFGYSLPLTDLALVTMLAQVTSGSAKWTIIDPKGEEIAGRLRAIGVAEDQLRTGASPDDLTDTLERDWCREMTAVVGGYRVGGDTPEVAPILILVGGERRAIVRALVEEDDRVLLMADWLGGPNWAIPADYPRKGALVELCQRSRPKPLAVRFDDPKGDFCVLGVGDPEQGKGTNAVLDWFVLEVQDQPSQW
jgi:hypothetical protein